jgi:hypothetical protein
MELGVWFGQRSRRMAGAKWQCLLLGRAVVIADALFGAGGMPTIQNRAVSGSIVHTHAGDDSAGKIWGIEGINILSAFMKAELGLVQFVKELPRERKFLLRKMQDH